MSKNKLVVLGKEEKVMCRKGFKGWYEVIWDGTGFIPKAYKKHRKESEEDK